MKFIPVKFPIPYWTGPYSPAAGVKTGTKVKFGYAGAWCDTKVGLKFRTFEKSEGADLLSKLVINEFNGGGRIVILPNGYVLKPENDDDAVGYQRLIGKIEGDIIFPLIKENFKLGPAIEFELGSKWEGPLGGAVKCTVGDDGAIHTSWSVPCETGAKEYHKQLTEPNIALTGQINEIKRKYGDFGRIYYWYGGHLTTAKHERYIGKVNCNSLDSKTEWFEME